MNPDIHIAVIPVAGLGTRLLPATKSQPKEMLPVARKPVVQYVVEELEANGIKQILFVTGRGKTSIENHFDFDHELMRHLRETGKEELIQELEYERLRLQFFFTRQRKQKGLGDAIAYARHFTGARPFVVALGDSIVGLHASSRVVQRMVRAFRENNPACVIALEEVPPESVSQYGIVKPGGEGEVFPILDLVEKPSPQEAPSALAIAARYVLSPSIYEALEETPTDRRGEIQLTDAIRILLRQGEKVLGVRLSSQERRYDIGNFQSYFDAFVDFALSDPQLGSQLRERLEERFREDR
ncbi:MAG: UTP--glucose-1-phosphate uridylyltransferase [Planctomycetes bacterium]|nr:UTP--glucose-1-phosphate uridylyltransferase [Planctomycetota bacterium]